MRDSMPTVHRGLDYERKLWPHFAEEFVSYEHQVLRARRLLFADSNEECERGGWQHLLGASLVVPTDAMRCETVAALGWAISWLGRMRALAPADETSTPALGLTAWLACLAPRPDGMVRDRWHSQVLEWQRGLASVGMDVVASRSVHAQQRLLLAAWADGQSSGLRYRAAC